VNLAEAFTEILEEFGILDNVRLMNNAKEKLRAHQVIRFLALHATTHQTMT